MSVKSSQNIQQFYLSKYIRKHFSKPIKASTLKILILNKFLIANIYSKLKIFNNLKYFFNNLYFLFKNFYYLKKHSFSKPIDI